MVSTFSWPPFAFLMAFALLHAWKRLRRGPCISRKLHDMGFLAQVVTLPTVLFYAFLVALCVNADWVYSMSSFFGLLDPKITVLHPEAAAQSWSTSDGIAPPVAYCEAMREAICQTTVCRGDTCAIEADPVCLAAYPSPCDVVVIPRLLRWLCLLSPPCVVLAMLGAMWHSWEHMKFGRPWRDDDDPDQAPRHYVPHGGEEGGDSMHGLAVQICGLAPVYGIFSLMSVVHMVALFQFRTDTQLWKVDEVCDSLLKAHGIGGVPRRCWAGLIDRSERWYNLNFLVADLYEAWALYCFGQLCMEYLDLQRRKRGLFGHSCPGCSSRCPNPSCNSDKPPISMAILAPLKEITLQGLNFFVYTNIARSSLMISLEILRMHSPASWESVNTLMVSSGATDSAWTGFVFCVSSFAIVNLFTFQHHLSSQFHGFRPRLKFFGARFVVTLAFLQAILLKTVVNRTWNRCQSNLAYASLVSIEMLLLAVVQYRAWHPVQLDVIARMKRQDSALVRPDDEQVEFLVVQGPNKLQVRVAEKSFKINGEEKTCWQHASVLLLANEYG